MVKKQHYTIDHLRKERRRATHRRRRVIYDNDGCDAYCEATEATPDGLLRERAIPHLGGHVDSVFYCTTASLGLYSHNTKVAEVLTKGEIAEIQPKEIS